MPASRKATRPTLVALVGNPNSGKTSLFNALTGAYQKVGNYPGVTVEKVSGTLKVGDREAECVDLPGLYSLTALSEDERVGVDALTGPERPDVVVYVADSTQLERGLYLLAQLLALGIPTVVAVTMSDLLAKSNGRIDCDLLAQRLGVPVVATVGHRGVGLDALRRALAEASGTPPTEGLPADEPDARYAWAETLARDVVHVPKSSSVKAVTDRIDRILIHRVAGLGVFFGVMYLVFQAIYTVAAPIMDAIDAGVGWLKGFVGGFLGGVPLLQSAVVDGLIAGVGSVLVFLPQIAILFLFIAFLEGTGYLARAAFLMDRLLGWCGLSGRAFIPLLSSFACAIPGIMAARVMPDQRSRLATILVAPLMSCSARLPVYVLLIGAFIEPQFGAAWAGFSLFAMHLVGLVVAVPVAWVLNKGALKGKRLPFVLELPSYQWPKWRDVVLTVWGRIGVFLRTAGTIIVVMSVVIWALGTFPKTDPDPSLSPQKQAEAQLANSALGRFGKAIEPVFVPAGFDWRLATAILSAFPAREVVVPSMGIMFSLGGEVDETSGDLRDALRVATWPDGRPLMTPWVAVGLMVFFALCCQCMATLATIRRETGSWKWPAIVFGYMTALAYLSAVAIHALGKAMGG